MEWREVPDFPGYLVSSTGLVRSPRRTLKQVVRGKYLSVTLCGSRHRQAYVHVLVLEVFVGPRPTGAVTRHLDGDNRNNALSNLTWGTYSENALDRARHGRYARNAKARCPRGHPFDEVNTYINPSGHQMCRRCNAERARERRSLNSSES